MEITQINTTSSAPSDAPDLPSDDLAAQFEAKMRLQCQQ